VAVGDGELAISRLATERPDIVLADIGMPKRNGYEVAAFVKNTPDFAHIPVVLLAGAFEPVDDTRAKEVKSDGVIVKPFEPQQLIARVHELVDGHRQTGAVVIPSGPSRGAPPPAPVPVRPPQASVTPPVPEPERPRQPAEQIHEGSLDEYFDRLDAAFASLGATTTPDTSIPGPVADPFRDHDVPTVDEILEDGPARIAAAPPVPPAPSPVSAGVSSAAPANVGHAIADLFRVLFAAEQGEGEAALSLRAAPPPVTDELVDEVTRRVLERIAPDTAKRLVADIVSRVAERLVREEIQRVKTRQ
jgi:CheY-like chemotaxis protein